jgi:23S rRNA pseudouridine2604 synthase
MLTNKEAKEAILNGRVCIDGSVIAENIEIENWCEISLDKVVVRQKKTRIYLKFYKPKGMESTLNNTIDGNLAPFFAGYEGLSIAGRLDKNSEGLLLLSNDGKWIETIINPKAIKEKEYLVLLDKSIDDEFCRKFSNGVDIGFYVTQPCYCEKKGDKLVRVILTEGKKKQISRMCKALGYTVVNLKRIRIHNYLIENMQEGELVEFTPM